MTTNNGPAVLFRNDQAAGNRSLRFTLVGTKSNRDAIGAARARLPRRHVADAAWCKSGSSYLSQSELPVTFGVGTPRPRRSRGHRPGRAAGPRSSRTFRLAVPTSALKARASARPGNPSTRSHLMNAVTTPRYNTMTR